MSSPSDKPYDIAILGAGPAGYVGAIRAAQLGARVAVVEKRELGGTCLNRGCIPSKAIIRAADLLSDAKSAGRIGIEFGEPKVNIEGIRKHKDLCVKMMVSGIYKLFDRDAITLYRGAAGFASPREIVITAADGSEERISAAHTLIATGAVPLIPPIPGVDSPGVITSDDAVDLPGPPARLVVVGGGAVGAEFCHVYSKLGTKVTLVEMLPQIVPTEDLDVAQVLASAFGRGGVTVLTGTKMVGIEKTDDGLAVSLEDADGAAKVVHTDMVLLAVGRKAELGDLHLDGIGVEVQRRGVQVDDEYRTSVEGIYAVGDCIRGIGLAHWSSHEAVKVMEDVFGEGGHINNDAVPGCIFTKPEIASVGLTEKKAEAAGIPVSVGRFPMTALGKAAALGVREGFIKVLADPTTGRVLGGVAVGPYSTELISEITLAVTHGLTAEQVANTMHAHPTIHEGTGEAALAALGRAIHLP